MMIMTIMMKPNATNPPKETHIPYIHMESPVSGAWVTPATIKNVRANRAHKRAPKKQRFISRDI